MKRSPALFAVAALCAASPLSAQNEDAQKPSPEEVAERKESMEARLLEFTSPNLDNPQGPRIENWREARPTQADYPPQSWLAGEEGRVGYEIAVDADGSASDCQITDSTGYPALDRVTCAVLLERAQFTSARNDEGEAIAATYKGRYFWRKRDPEVPGTFRFRARFVVDETGQATNCVIEAKEGALPKGMAQTMDKNPCPFGSRRNPIPYRDEEGVPVAKNVVVEFSAKVSDFDVDAQE